VPLEIRIGEAVPIPCRHCRRIIRTSAANHLLKCPTCEAITVVRIRSEAGRVLVFTEALTAARPVRPAP
jgi:phage FluMu protein Com